MFESSYGSGERKGLKKGLKQGREEGREEGEHRKARQIARRLLRDHDDETVAKLTGLCADEVARLREDDASLARS